MSKPDDRRIKVWAEQNIDFFVLPDGWDEWSRSRQQEWLSDAAQLQLENNIDYGAELSSTSDDEYEENFYSDADE